jgi:hypothetical protein
MHRLARQCSLLLAVLALGVVTSPTAAQPTIHGVVTDAESGTPLPSANIQIADTYQGTITNTEGEFSLQVDALPVTLVVRFIGYETQQRTIEGMPDAPIRIALSPSTLEMDEVVVTGENPAARIMRRVIERKQQWRADLETYQVEAYNRFTVANDTGIVSIIETQTQAFWDKERGMREVQTAKRQTANLDIDEAVPSALFVTNLYDDNIEMGGHTLMGVTHPDALSHYTFTLDSTRAIDGQRVYDIGVRPDGRLRSAFEGRVAVLDSAYAVLEADLRPNRSFVFPPPVRNYRVRLEQQFSNFGGSFWLPVDLRAHHEVNIAFTGLISLPPIRINQVSRLTRYETNVPLPDSLYERDERVVMDSTALARLDALAAEPTVPDTLAFAGGSSVPLTADEQRAYSEIDSTTTLDKAFAPRGPLGRLIRARMEAEDNAGDGSASPVATQASGTYLGGVAIDRQLRPLVWYNRVEGLHAGAALQLDVDDRFLVEGRGGYNTSIEAPLQWNYGVRTALRLGADRDTRLVGSYRYGVDRQYRSPVYGRLPNSIWTLGGGFDYFDYMGNERIRVGVVQQLPRWDASVRVQYNNERHFSVNRNTSYDLFGREQLQPINPSVNDDLLRSLSVHVEVGDPGPQLGIFGENVLRVDIEHSNSDWLSSGFDFTRFQLQLDGHIETFFQRRAIPNALDVRLVGGTFTGTLPVQRFGIVDASWRPFNVFGTLKTLAHRPYRGEQYAGLLWEHSFRTVPLELLGLYSLAERGYNILIHGGHGRSWISDARQTDLLQRGIPIAEPEGFHHELGVSVSGLLGAFRLDVTKRLDAPGFTIGLGLARLY